MFQHDISECITVVIKILKPEARCVLMESIVFHKRFIQGGIVGYIYIKGRRESLLQHCTCKNEVKDS